MAREIVTKQLSLGSTVPTLFSPDLTVPATSDNLDFPHRVYWSKFQQPDAVPEANFQDVGSADDEILNGFPLTTALILTKERGVWRQTGADPFSWELLPLEPTTRFSCRDAAAFLDNNGYCISDQGLVRISDGGVQIISWPIEIGLKKIFSFPNWQSISHGLGYCSDRSYTFWTPEGRYDTFAKIGWRFNHMTNKWSTLRKNVRHTYNTDHEDRLYFAEAVDGFILKERRSYETSDNDYQDEDIPVTVTATGTAVDASGFTVSTADVTYSYTGMSLARGFYFQQGFGSSPVMAVTSLGGTSYRLTLREKLPTLVTGSATVAMPIVSTIRMKPEIGGNAAVLKKNLKVQWYMQDESAVHADLAFATDIQSDVKYYPVELKRTRGFGFLPFGSAPFGCPDDPPAKIFASEVPPQYAQSRSFSSIFRHSFARECFKLLNVSLTLRVMSEKTTQEPR
jgi:hypothetical protein